MDPETAQERALSSDPAPGEPEAVDFVRFCYRRRHVGWPELYDEMCAVAGRGLYHGYCADDLSRIGIGFALFEMPALATIVQQVVAEDLERRRLSAEAVRARYVAPDAVEGAAPIERVAMDDVAVDPSEKHVRLVAVPAGF